MVQELDLTGRVALITAAGRGIGAGIAEVFTEAGCDIALNALTERYVEPLAERLRDSTGRKVVVLTGDVTARDDVVRVVDRTFDELGRLDILVNNLGDAIRGPIAPLPDSEDARALSDDDVQQVLDINLVSALHCVRAAGGRLLGQHAGKVINISGYAGVRGRAGQTVYAAAKAGLVGLTRALAVEWAPYGVQVNAIAPGTFPDPVTVGEDGYDAAVRDAKERVPLGRVGDPREVGLLALYLASPASDYMTGQVLCLDGGLTA